jgi:predicted AAA+ superfamily ATPase
MKLLAKLWIFGWIDKLGRPTKRILMVGLRGVGKTVLLDRMRSDAEGVGIHTLRIEAPENRSLPALLAPQLRQSLLRLSPLEHAKERATRALPIRHSPCSSMNYST